MAYLNKDLDTITEEDLYKEDREEGEKLCQKYGVTVGPSGFWVGLGWQLLVEGAFKELKALGWNGKLAQAKQKFRELTLYLEPPVAPEMRAVVAKYRKLSHDTCETCGMERADKGFGYGLAQCDICEAAFAIMSRRQR